MKKEIIWKSDLKFMWLETTHDKRFYKLFEVGHKFAVAIVHVINSNSAQIILGKDRLSVSVQIQIKRAAIKQYKTDNVK